MQAPEIINVAPKVSIALKNAAAIQTGHQRCILIRKHISQSGEITLPDELLDELVVMLQLQFLLVGEDEVLADVGLDLFELGFAQSSSDA